MRIGVVSDIHGNCVALDAVIEDVRTHPVDRWVCLGDALQGGPQPREVAERLQELECPIVLGNADAFVLDGNSGEVVITDELRVVRQWTYDQLGPPGTEFLRTFRPTIDIDLNAAGKMLCFHGSPDSYDTIVSPDTPPDTLREQLGGRGARTLCGGHIHRQWTVSLDGWTFFNPGSVGLAYNVYLPPERFHCSPHAEFAILHVDDDRIGIELLRVPFDLALFDRAVRSNDHPDAALAARFRPPQ